MYLSKHHVLTYMSKSVTVSFEIKDYCTPEGVDAQSGPEEFFPCTQAGVL